ncbi:MAG: UDP-N-acetylmuramoyl-tripeptide--D-alanyl-D-alanine ligase, partial [Duodenibacillus sp.]|nr:UDP-N-acetylmuramoyl-tripeptide--D-alanyl-D-alanine ligase [Duodenibacillus sp.]
MPMMSYEMIVQALGDAVRAMPDAIAGDILAVTTDSREVAPGSVFIALRGERFDGHDFVAGAFEAGAVLAVVEEPTADPMREIVVRDTAAAYGLIARRWRLEHRGAKVIAVVGANGKTTAKNMVAEILKAHFGPEAVLATEGNFNNQVGVPKTLLRLTDAHKAAVVEAGMNHPGEMARLARWIVPDAVLVTNAQREHQEFIDGPQGSARENGLMLVALGEDGTAVLPAKDACLPIWKDYAEARGCKTVEYAAVEGAWITARLDTEQGDSGAVLLTEGLAQARTTLALPGAHALHDAAGAVAAARAVGASLASAARGLAAFRPAAGRGERHA